MNENSYYPEKLFVQRKPIITLHGLSALCDKCGQTHLTAGRQRGPEGEASDLPFPIIFMMLIERICSFVLRFGNWCTSRP